MWVGRGASLPMTETELSMTMELIPLTSLRPPMASTYLETMSSADWAQRLPETRNPDSNKKDDFLSVFMYLFLYKISIIPQFPYANSAGNINFIKLNAIHQKTLLLCKKKSFKD